MKKLEEPDGGVLPIQQTGHRYKQSKREESQWFEWAAASPAL